MELALSLKGDFAKVIHNPGLISKAPGVLLSRYAHSLVGKQLHSRASLLDTSEISRTHYDWTEAAGQFAWDIFCIQQTNLINFVKSVATEDYQVAVEIGAASDMFLKHVKAERKIGINVLDVCIEQLNRQGITGMKTDGQRMPLADDEADLVICFETLEHVVNEKTFLEEIHRVLKPGGVIMLSVPNRGAAEILDIDNIVFTPILWILKKMGFFKNVSDYYLRYHRHYSKNGLEKLFGSLFKIEKVYYGGLVANQLAFLIYKSLYLILLLLKFKRSSWILRFLHDWMNRVSSWDFDHCYGKFSDKLSIYARKGN